LLLENMRRAAGPWRAELGSALEFLGRQRGLSRLSKYAPLVNVPLSSYYFGRTGGPFGYFRENLQTLCTPEFLAGVDHVDAARFTGHLFAEVQGQFENQPVLNQMLYVDTKTWLPDDLLIKADKMTMANSLELRVPLLDHGLLEFAAGLPPNYKVRGWNTKRILKAAFKGIIPDAIIHRRKTGLPVPLRRWMRGDLASYVREVLLSREALQRGYFTRAGVEKLLADNDRDGSLMKYVFALLTLELWHREFADA
jgi:asparagine synthase (glutamine-hydrolysing)